MIGLSIYKNREYWKIELKVQRKTENCGEHNKPKKNKYRIFEIKQQKGIGRGKKPTYDNIIYYRKL